MKKTRKRILSELKKIANHFRLSLSKIEIIRKTAIALDDTNKKLIVMDEDDHPYFKTFDLHNIDACAVKVAYRSIDAGELREKDMDEFIEKIQLQISHVDPTKSIDIGFYDMKKNTVHELRALIDKARSWRDKITAMRVPANMQLRA